MKDSDQSRTATTVRTTKETDIRAQINLDGTGTCSVQSGLGFLDHMFEAIAKHSQIDLELSCRGDLEVDDHHTVEDCALVFGELVRNALGSKVGIQRFGYAYAPLDEALARTVVDFSGRASAVVNLELVRERIGEVSTENISHFFRSFATQAAASLHVDVLRGDNDHHRAEAAFKSFALALRQAVSKTGIEQIPSTKGVL